MACPESILTSNKTDLLGLVDVELLVDKLEGLDLVDEVPHTGGAGSECGYSTLIAPYLLLLCAGRRGEEEEEVGACLTIHSPLCQIYIQ